jgi:hypothetical protein
MRKRLKAVNGICSFVLGVTALFSSVSYALGPSPYLPLNMSPRIERQIEKVLLLAGKPVMRRPIAASVVQDALPAACERDRAVCEEVRHYLERYKKSAAITSLRPQVALAAGDSTATLPNRHGEPVDATWQVAGNAYYQPFDYLILNAGGIAYDQNATATGTFLSTGFHFAQLDIGFRDHWLSPLSDSSSLISTEAPTMPSVTLSNYQPLTPLGLSYEVFYAESSKQNGIAYLNSTTSGKPRIGGLQFVMEPVRGYALSANRLVQYGGGARNTGGFSQFTNELFERSNKPDAGGLAEGSNRIASLNSSIQFPGKVPFAVHVEYAAEDNAYAGNYRLGATNVTVGLDLPILWKVFDATVEMSEWQNDWYVHPIYPFGLSNRDRIVGHWFGDNRLLGDAIGGASQSLAVGWQLPSGYARARYRHLAYDVDWAGVGATRPYDDLHSLALSYSIDWRGRPIEAELLVGQDVFGESFARLGAAVDFGAEGSRRLEVYDTSADAPSTTEVFIDLGTVYSRVQRILGVDIPNVTTAWDANIHAGIGARRRVSERSDFGVRLEVDRADGHQLISLRAIDYRFRWSRRLALGGFFGLGRYDTGLPGYGYYWGAGVQYVDLMPRWDLSLDFRQHDKLGRDKRLANDPPSTPDRTRVFFDVDGAALYLSRRF